MTFSPIADSNDRGAQELAANANAMSDDQAKALQAGMDDYISKPFNFQGVKAIIEIGKRNFCKKRGWSLDGWLGCMQLKAVSAIC